MPTTTIPTHHMQMANKWRAKKDCGFQGYGSFSGRGCVCWISLVLILVLVPGKWIINRASPNHS